MHRLHASGDTNHLSKGDTLQKLAFLGGAAGIVIAALLIGHDSKAADHLDAPATMANPMADIADVYAWMTPDGSDVNLAMTVSPADDSTRHFGPSVLYTFHVTSTPGFTMPGTEMNVICKLSSDTMAQCWIGTVDYVTGDPSNTAGVTSTDGRVKLFAGTRSDPFFFNLQGFRDAVTTVEGAAGGLTFNAAGCPTIDNNTGAALRGLLQEGAQTTAGAPCSTTSADCFAALNVKVILLQIDKKLLNVGTNTVLGVWASTNMAQ